VIHLVGFDSWFFVQHICAHFQDSGNIKQRLASVYLGKKNMQPHGKIIRKCV